jgi:hypothetical protein
VAQELLTRSQVPLSPTPVVVELVPTLEQAVPVAPVVVEQAES